MEARVVGGNFARIEDFPHSVFLNMKCNQKWICGASVLNQRLLLTAAHCVFPCDLGKKGHKIEAFMGNEYLKKAEVKRVVTDVIIHEEYNDDSLENDIAIVKVDVTFPLRTTIKRVIIRKTWPCQDSPGGYGFIAGWGLINDTIPVRTLNLMAVNQKMRPQRLCSKLLGPMAPGMFCAGGMLADDPYAAQGDSGSALMFHSVYQIGLVSFKVKAYPAMMVYSNMTYYYKWIKYNSARLFCRSAGFNKQH